ncbi:MAG: response regulator FixJ [Phenylobacterium sp.]
MTTPIVHVIDDDEAMRRSLAFLLGSAGYASKTYESAVAFLAAGEPEPGCIITDVRMPDLTGLELVRRLKSEGSALPIVMITGHGDVPLAVEAMKAGVVDFIEKPFDAEVLLAAIGSALAGRARTEQQDEERRRFQQMLAQLSPRETEVLRGVVTGKPNKIIAYELGISPRTVEIYRANVMTKTAAGSLSELVRMALLAGF